MKAYRLHIIVTVGINWYTWGVEQYTIGLSYMNFIFF